MKNIADEQYLSLLKKIIEEGNDKGDRTGTGTRSIFGHQMRFNISEYFPLLTTKFVAFKAMTHELLWMIKGDTNIKYLNDNNVKIWDEWADKNGDLGPVYGKMWRSWPSQVNNIDQLQNCIDQIKNNPDSRRIIVSSWNPELLPVKSVPSENPTEGKQALPPCHALFQFYVHDGKLSCQLYQRSCDVFLGVPFNIASYALLTYIIADITELEPYEFIWTGGDVHIYNNHFDQVKEQLNNEVKESPKLLIKRTYDKIDDYKFEDFSLINYESAPKIKAPIAV